MANTWENPKKSPAPSTPHGFHFPKIKAAKAMKPPGVPDSFEPRMDAIPDIGEHTDAILAELGYSDEQIRQLHDGKVV